MDKKNRILFIQFAFKNAFAKLVCNVPQFLTILGSSKHKIKWNSFSQSMSQSQKNSIWTKFSSGDCTQTISGRGFFFMVMIMTWSSREFLKNFMNVLIILEKCHWNFWKRNFFRAFSDSQGQSNLWLFPIIIDEEKNLWLLNLQKMCPTSHTLFWPQPM